MVEKLAKLIYFALITAILYFAFPMFVPFLLAVVVAVLFEPFVQFLIDKLKIGRMVSVVFILSFFFISVFSLLYISIFKLIKEAIGFAKDVPTQVDSFIHKNHWMYEFYSNLSSDNQTYLKDSVIKILDKLSGFVSNYAGDLFVIVKSFPTYFIAFLIFIVASYIMSFELPKLKGAFLHFFEEGSSREKMEIVLEKLKKAVVGFLRAQLILSFVTFVITVIGLFFIGTKFVVVPAFIIVFVDLLPILGTGSVLIPWAVYDLVAGSIGDGVGLIILFVAITVIRRIIEPKLLADSLGIKPLITLISMYVGFQLLGLIGMILGPAIIIVVHALEESDLLKIKIKF